MKQYFFVNSNPVITENINRNMENNLFVQKICKRSFEKPFLKGILYKTSNTGETAVHPE